MAYVFYAQFIVYFSDIYYYSCSALLNLVTGIALHSINKRAAICSYLLVLTNVLGFWLWFNYYESVIYDNIALFILAIQAVLVLPKGALNGFRFNIKHSLAESAFFDSNRACVTMYKNHSTKKNN